MSLVGAKESEKQSRPTVSVIVPCYNLELTLAYCLDSILAQTFRDFEVVCVDDGSIDGTWEMLSRYSREDERVVPLRQENRGLSAARNAGVAHACGDYIAFVDGDDYVSPYYLELLLQGMQGRARRIVVAQSVGVSLDNALSRWFPEQMSKGAHCETISLSELLYRDYVASCWGRLFPRYVVEQAPLTRRYYEDLEVAAQYLSLVDEILIVDTPLYFYVRRPGSIVNAAAVSVGQVKDYEEALDHFIDELEKRGAEKRPLAYYASKYWTRVYFTALRCKEDPEYASSVRRRCVSEVRKNLATTILDPRPLVVHRIRLLVLAAFPALYGPLFRWFVATRVRLSKGRKR